MASLPPQLHLTKFNPGIDEPVNHSDVDGDENMSPLTDIKTSFDNIFLNAGLDKDAPFASVTHYSPGDAPNPSLFIEGLGGGAIQLPPREEDVRVLLSFSVGGIAASGWKIPGTKIKFNNPAWSRWVERVAGPATLRALRVATQLEQFEFDLKDLLLIESAHTPGKIGDLLFVLPSPFSGGAVQFTHDDEVKKFELAGAGNCLAVVGAYVGVEQEWQPVESGSFIALHYEVLHHGVHPPTLAGVDGPKQKIREILRSWQGQPEYAGPFIAFHLGDVYQQSTFDTVPSLHSHDQKLWNILQSLAYELGYSTHIVEVEITTKVPVDFGEGDSVARIDDDSFVEDSFAFSFATSSFTKEASKELQILRILTPGGIPVVIEGLDVELTDLINVAPPGSPLPKANSSKLDDQCANMIRTYNRTLLLISPKNTTDLNTTLADAHELAYNMLSTSSSTTATPKEKRILRYLTAWVAMARQDEDELRRVLTAIQVAGKRWNDVDGFLGAMEAARISENPSSVAFECLVSAVRTFGWSALQNWFHSCTLAALSEPSKARRWEFFMALSGMALVDDLIDVQFWCQWHQSYLLRNLNPVHPADLQWLIDVSVIGGGEFVRDILYPQLKIQCLPVVEFWAPFFHQLYENRARISPGKEDVVCGVIHNGVEVLVGQLWAFPTTVRDGVEEPNVDIVVQLIEHCVSIGRVDLCSVIARRMRAAAAAGEHSPSVPPWRYYLLLANALDAWLGATPADGLEEFFQDTLRFVLSPLGQLPDRRLVFPCTFEGSILATVKKAVQRVGGATFLKDLFSVHREMLCRETDTLKVLARCIADSSNDEDYEVVINSIVESAAATFGLQYAGKPYIAAYKVVEFCLETNAPGATQERFLSTVMSAPPNTTIAQHMAQTTIPFAFRLKQALAERGLDIKTLDVPRAFFRSVIEAFAQDCMPPKPTDKSISVENLRRIGCAGNCRNCVALRKFALDGRTTTSFQERRQDREHLERQMGGRGLGFHYQTLKGTRPYILEVINPCYKEILECLPVGQITKSATLIAVGTWYTSQMTGKRLLGMVGNVEAQQEVLGEGYSRVLEAIEGVEARAPLATLNR
ncbi:hypothetical protein C8R46DRAFT_1026318 [Mycena filopes]|nr:hypothetical protein C8R46DRAFT_1026318 [Mycena filopes]